MTFGKVMGGGFPAAAFGGRADVMAMLSPEGPVYQAGTLSGNPVATAAGLATLRLATDEVYARVDEVAATISTAAAEALTAAGVPHVLQSNGNMFSIFFGDLPRACPTTRPRRPRTSRPSRPSSTRCSTAASTCRRARSRCGSAPRPTTTARCSRCSTPCRHAASAAGAVR